MHWSNYYKIINLLDVSAATANRLALFCWYRELYEVWVPPSPIQVKFSDGNPVVQFLFRWPTKFVTGQSLQQQWRLKEQFTARCTSEPKPWQMAKLIQCQLASLPLLRASLLPETSFIALATAGAFLCWPGSALSRWRQLCDVFVEEWDAVVVLSALHCSAEQGRKIF